MTTTNISLLAQQEAEAEAQRQQAWAVFVASLRDVEFHEGWAEVFTAVSEAYDDFDGTPLTAEIRAFGLLYGWPDTLRAVAQAMAADEQFKREAEGRR